MEILHSLTSTDLQNWVTPSSSLSQLTRRASQHLFSVIRPYAQKSPLDTLLVDGFDAEQIWNQIDLQSQPLMASLQRQIKYFERNPGELKMLEMDTGIEVRKMEDAPATSDQTQDTEECDGHVSEDQETDYASEGHASEELDSENDGENMEVAPQEGVEDRFFNMKELEEFLVADEAREYGFSENMKNQENEDEQNEGINEDDDEVELFGDANIEDEEELGNARYEDFYGKDKKMHKPNNSKIVTRLEEDLSEDDEQSTDSQVTSNKYDEYDMNNMKHTLSTHEKNLEKLQAEIIQVEKSMLEPKHWTMQGEVTAGQRPKNSALEVDLDFNSNVRPPPTITEEVTASLEDVIKKRIIEGLFDDIQRVTVLPTKEPSKLTELDESKSKKGLAEVYEEVYVKKANPGFVSSTAADKEKKEATLLFKTLCAKLDALSHFHFAPKPIIEDMSVQTDLPALAMEEIAPTAVSDAAMLAPEEIFSGKGDIKEDAELTQAERKRRRARKKRKFKAKQADNAAKKTRVKSSLEQDKE